MFQIPEAYRCRIMGSLIQKGYISGAYPVEMTGQEIPGIKTTPQIGITIDGVQFLHENPMMAKVRKILWKSFEVFLSSAGSRRPS